jgi:phosphoserine phosphatase
VLCARPEVRDGVLTGGLLGGPMIGEGKRAAVRAVLRAHPEAAARDCYAYGDHISDLPMLAEVGHPVVVGADPELARRLPLAQVMTTGQSRGVT